MNLELNNRTSSSERPQRPDTNNSVNADYSVNLDAVNALGLDERSRVLAEQMSLPTAKLTNGIEDKLEIPKEEKALQVLSSAVNAFRKLGSGALNIAGFVGISMSALSYVMFNFKFLAAIIAAPAVGAFYIANSLKKSAKLSEKELGLMSDPVEILKKARMDSLFLEGKFNKIVAAMVKVGEMKNKDPRKMEAFQELKVIADKVRAKRTELSRVDAASHEILDINKFIEIYDNLHEQFDQDQSEIDLPESIS